jgi:hypothetical protein
MSYDIHFQPVPAEEALGTRIFTFGFRATLKVQGAQALVNRWVKTFMTPKGSNPLDLEEGTAFGRMVGSNINAYHQGIEDVILLSIEDANDQVRKQDLDGLFPEDERLSNATLFVPPDNYQIDMKAGRDFVELWVRIVNVAGKVLPVRLIELADR